MKPVTESTDICTKLFSKRTCFMILTAMTFIILLSLFIARPSYASYYEYSDDPSVTLPDGRNERIYYIRTNMVPELVIANGLESNLAAKETPENIARNNNAICAINAGVWYTADDFNEYIQEKYARGTVGIADNYIGNIYKSSEDAENTLILNSNNSLGIATIGSQSAYQSLYNNGNGIKWAVKGKGPLIINGNPVTVYPDGNDQTNRHPRAFIAKDNSGYYYIGVTGGRGYPDSDDVGFTYPELANALINDISSNIQFAYALDGGCSGALYEMADRKNPVLPEDGVREERPVSNCLCFHATGWLKSNNDWYYYDNTYVFKTEWQKINNVWYYFNDNGVMQTGWKKINNKWYYFADNGPMQTGWKKINNKWYYFADNGAMQTGWKKIDNIWYYLADNGAMQTGWTKINNNWYYFSNSGAMQTGWLNLNNNWYYLQSSGVMSTGQQHIDGYWYCFHDSGAMYKNEWLEYEGNWFHYGSDGKKQFGWTLIDGDMHYFESATGAGLVGRQRLALNGTLYWFFFNNSGVMLTEHWETVVSGSNTYTFYYDNHGKGVTGLVTIGNYQYYFNNDGVMQTGWIQINGSWEYFDETTGRRLDLGNW